MSTTVNKIQGIKANRVIVDDIVSSASSFDVRHGIRPAAWADYTMKRLGRKDYAFFDVDSGNWGGQRMVVRYNTSHLEARRRFALMLITQRMLS